MCKVDALLSKHIALMSSPPSPKCHLKLPSGYDGKGVGERETLSPSPPDMLALQRACIKHFFQWSFYFSFNISAKGGGYRHRDGDRHHYGKHRDDDKMECRPPVTFDKLPMKCTVSEDCTTYSCSLDGDIVTLSLKIDVSHKPFSAEVSLKVPSKGFDWSHTFKNGDKIQVPGFPQRIMGREVADLYLMFKMYEDKMGHGMNFKVTVSKCERVAFYLI